MEKLKQMKEILISQVEAQLGDVSKVNTHELGEVIDMIKDLEQSMYYCSIVEAMEDKKEDDEVRKMVRQYVPEDSYRDYDRAYGRMYYTPYVRDGGRVSMEELPMPRDRREGRSPMSRKMYMESKEMHHDKTVQMKELENYMAELSADIAEMIQMASPEEKAVLQKKLSALSAKIV